ncbi:hypothetical protein Ciccas_005252 [Cichlidogyrus casuarinus]|uniref:Uncharacterized protein n=1 Tax=Cichlidogyrus casuarinus TaxID=1844966 RepID=A0ABD2QBH3_9PLAT
MNCTVKTHDDGPVEAVIIFTDHTSAKSRKHSWQILPKLISPDRPSNQSIRFAELQNESDTREPLSLSLIPLATQSNPFKNLDEDTFRLWRQSVVQLFPELTRVSAH